MDEWHLSGGWPHLRDDGQQDAVHGQEAEEVAALRLQQVGLLKLAGHA